MPYKDLEQRKEYSRCYGKEYREKNKDKISAYRREWDKQHPEVVAKRKEYQKKYRVAHLEERQQKGRQASREYRLNNPNYRLTYKIKNNKYREELRKQVIAHFGGKCVRCGYNDWRALQIDHINGGGTKALKIYRHNSHRYHKDLLLVEPNVDYQLLCSNCNWLKRYEKSETDGSFLTAYNIGQNTA